MRCRKTRLRRFIRRKTTSALLCAAGFGAAGCAGSHLDVSSRWPAVAPRTGEERSATARVAGEDADRDSASRIEQTGLERILPFRRDAGDDDSRESSSGGRVFSAFVNRLPGRRSSTTDPFLDDRPVAPKSASSAQPDPRTPTAGVARTTAPIRQVVARTTTPPPQGERSDAELWQMFNNDVAGTASVRTSAPVSAPARTPSPVAATKRPAPPSNDSLPVWAREQPTPPTSTSNTRDLAAIVAQAPRSQQERPGRARVNPSSKPQTVATAPANSRREIDQRLEQLLREARSHQEKGDLFQAYRIAVIAEELAEREHIVFAPRQQRPIDIVREIEHLMQASLSAADEAPAVAAPPTVVAQQPPVGPVAVAAPDTVAPVAAAAPRKPDPFADNTGPAQRPAMRTASARQPGKAASTSGRFDSEFPALHEWRGVRANSPVSLAMGNTAAEANNELPEHPVQHALATGDSTGNQAPLLARAEAERHQMLAAAQGTSLFSSELRTPALTSASHPDLQPVVVPAPPPPLDVSPRKPDIAAAGGRSSGRSLVWWVLGGLAVLTGGAALRYRQQPARRR